MKHSKVEVGVQLESAAAQVRTLDAMRADMGKETPVSPRVKQFRPTVPAEKYAELKAKPGALKPVAEKPAAARPKPHAPPILVGPDIEGATNVDGLYPPDTHGAIGIAEFVEVTNSHIDIFQRADPRARTSISLAAFFGYFNQILFDPRVVYDSVWNRWVVTAEAFEESPAVQYHFIAISTTPSALGPFFVYQLNVTFFNGDFWDFPQLGMDQDSIIVTANIFAAEGGYKGTDMFAVAKARLYNGLGFSVPVFTDLVGTLAPPIVLDQNANTFLVAAAPAGSALQLYILTNSSRPNAIELAGPIDVPVNAYTAPPDAPQPGTSAVLDSSDARFINASTQTGDSLWQVHTVDLVGFAAPRFYQIDLATMAVVQSSFFFASGTSFDFNASIAANGDNDMFLTWTATDPAQGINAQVRFSGCTHGDGPCFPGPGTALFTSPTSYPLFRWGDYSAVTVDPLSRKRAWLVNERVTDNGDWGSRIAGIGFVE